MHDGIVHRCVRYVDPATMSGFPSAGARQQAESRFSSAACIWYAEGFSGSRGSCRHGRLQSLGQALLQAAPETPGYVLTAEVDDDPTLSASFRNVIRRQYRINELVRYCLKNYCGAAIRERKKNIPLE